MANVIVVTNFSASSRNALTYICSLLQNTQAKLLLLNIFNYPAPLVDDGISLAAMSETIADDEAELQREYEWVCENFPGMHISTDMVTGIFLEELQNKVNEEAASLVVMGAEGHYSELLAWDKNILNAFVDITIPVLVIPSHITWRPIKKIAFACNYFRKHLDVPVTVIRKLAQLTQAALYIINVVSPQETIDAAALQNKQEFQQSLADLNPVYFEPAFDNIFTAVDNFTAEEQIDMLLVIPTRHGLWYNIFQKSHTKGLVYLNHIPVMSLRQNENFI